jgi:tRNA threonylcarbamoyl adenosine modification protein YeaZ/ribosomal-protein-alanine acetyltransferase
MAACSAAVIDTAVPAPLARAFVAMERGHAEALAPMIEQVMQEAAVSFSAIDRIVVTRGPGTFTGVRIGLAMARGLSLALGIPLIGIDTLTAIAANDAGDAPLLVAADARNGEVYAALFDKTRNVIHPPSEMTREGAVAIAPEGSVVIGTAAGALVAASGRRDLCCSRSGALPDAAVFARLGSRSEAVAPVSPLYLRAPDAKPQAKALRPQIIIEPAGPEAAGVLAGLHGLSFDTPWDENSFAGIMSSPGVVATVALESGEPLGFLLTRQAADEAEIITIGTKPTARRRGIAKRLIDHQLAEFPARGVAQVFLEVAEPNHAARALYQSLGFAEAGRRRGYYKRADGSVEDALLLRRALST